MDQAREKLSCASVMFNDDGTAEFTYGQVNPVRKFGGKKAWFLPILGYSENKKGVDISFRDGSNVPREAIDAYKGILEENCVDLKWKKGDILLVDNLSVQHSRRPGKPPEQSMFQSGDIFLASVPIAKHSKEGDIASGCNSNTQHYESPVQHNPYSRKLGSLRMGSEKAMDPGLNQLQTILLESV
ncbi:Clavaminate synthase-like protein [Acorus calamus]|uniref:Clavaminate synthase-like protein n=1 Tax=Acorus calamus TaxID=4465 RepID=A0AAV9FDM1_ACOCL|nr:Clavaminate synthase-like protein [Acorus calamus]